MLISLFILIFAWFYNKFNYFLPFLYDFYYNNNNLVQISMFPYMTKAKEHNLSIIVLNPNQTSYIDKQTYSNQEDTKASSENLDLFYLSLEPLPLLSSTKSIPNLSTSYEHFLYVYDNIIAKM
ncbi:unnamed protein product [Rotaria magnacalcarata]